MIQKDGIAANPLTTARCPRAVVKLGSLHHNSGLSVIAPPRHFRTFPEVAAVRLPFYLVCQLFIHGRMHGGPLDHIADNENQERSGSFCALESSNARAFTVLDRD